jgi:hypothetical protein
MFGRQGERWQPASRSPLAVDPADQQIDLRRWQLPELLSVVVVEGSQPPSDLRSLPNPFAQANAVAVPVVPELC